MRLFIAVLLVCLSGYAQGSMSTLFGGGKPVTKQQTFAWTSNFTPSAALLAQGGWVSVLAVGGGSGGGPGYGGSGGSVVEKMVQVTGATTATVGAGGGYQSSGGASSFGALVSAPGGVFGAGIVTVELDVYYHNAYAYSGGTGAGGMGSLPVSIAYTGSGSTISFRALAGLGGPCLKGYGGGAGTSAVACGNTGANSGGGGLPNAAGQSGVVIITWTE